MARVAVGYLRADPWEEFECCPPHESRRRSVLREVVNVVTEMGPRVESRSQSPGSLFHAIFLQGQLL